MGSIRRIFEHADRETRRRRDHAAIGAAIIDQLHFAVADRQSIMLRYCLMSYSGRVGKRDSRRDVAHPARHAERHHRCEHQHREPCENACQTTHYQLWVADQISPAKGLDGSA